MSNIWFFYFCKIFTVRSGYLILWNIVMNQQTQTHKDIGIVVIGRNEGDRLKTCLLSAIRYTSNIVYVDSDSTDNSLDIAAELNVEYVSLDLKMPFTAARARNEGYKRLKQIYPNLSFVQFVDGDCEISKGWLEQATVYLTQNSDVAVVCGRRRERYPEASIFNMMCDIEWNTPVGEAKACGGDALMRVDVFQQVSGFNPDVIAGEESELCVRIRQNGWKIWRLDLEMTLHDANITRFTQWWKRNIRAGYAYALGAAMHGFPPEFHRIHNTRRIWFWGLCLPVAIILSGIVNPLFFIFLFIYPVRVARIKYKNTHIVKHGWLYAFFVTLGNFPEAQGQIKFYINRLFDLSTKIIEYKN